MATNEDWQGPERRSGGDRRTMLHERSEREHRAAETVPDSLSKADASRLIDELQARRGHGANPSDGVG